MELSGDYKFKAPIDQVWQTFMSPAALKAALPGCEKLEQVEPNVFDVTLKVGVAAIKGTYNGRITIDGVEELRHYRLLVSGQGGSGSLKGEGAFDFSESGDDTAKETLVNYKGAANVGGTLAGIGGRMLLPVARKLAGDFFKNMDKQVQENDTAVQEAEGEPS